MTLKSWSSLSECYPKIVCKFLLYYSALGGDANDKFISEIETLLKVYYDIYVIDMGLLPYQSFIRGKRINHK